jgi:hypothetical protein
LAADTRRCPACCDGGVLMRREADLADWPRATGGALLCPSCGGAVRMVALRRAVQPAGAQ